MCRCSSCGHKWNYDEVKVREEKQAALIYQHKLNDLAAEVHEIAKSKGWWDEEKSFGDLTALIHSEVSEAFEEHRNHHKPDEIYFNGDKPEGIPIELADAVIRILDVCARYKIDFDAAVRQKIEFNKTRPIKHGGKKL
jgi:NTP pyrophosphatase (non-canonical NTP hydrolase)